MAKGAKEIFAYVTLIFLGILFLISLSVLFWVAVPN